MTAPRYSESLPTTTAPVEVPKVVPELSRARYLTGVITGGVLIAVTVTLLVVALVVLR